MSPQRNPALEAKPVHLTPNHYLPHSISDTLRTADDVARWLESQGETVVDAVTLPLCAYASTASGLRVYRNGWVCKSPTADEFGPAMPREWQAPPPDETTLVAQDIAAERDFWQREQESEWLASQAEA